MSLRKSILTDALRAVANGKAEVTEAGLFIPGANVFVGGMFGAAYAEPGSDDFGPLTIGANRVVNQGLNLLLSLLGSHASPPSGLYLAPFTGDVAPAASWTAASFATAATEFTAYTAANRLPWTTVAPTAQQLTNAAALAAATLTFNAGGPYTIRGLGLLTVSGKGSTTGALFAASRFAADLTGMQGGGRLAMEYALGAVDEGDV